MSWWSSFRWFYCGQDTFKRVKKWGGIWGWLRERVEWSLCGRICRSHWLCSCIEAGFHLLHEDSDGEHLCSEKVSRGFLRPSLEETLCLTIRDWSGRNRRRGLGAPVGYSFLCFPLVFLLCSFCFPHSFVSVFLLLPGEGVPIWTVPLVRRT